MNLLMQKVVKTKKIIEFSYNNEYYKVEPHCYGFSSKTNEAIRAYIINNHKTDSIGWKVFYTNKIHGLIVYDESFEIRPDYKKEDNKMVKVICEL